MKLLLTSLTALALLSFVGAQTAAPAYGQCGGQGWCVSLTHIHHPHREDSNPITSKGTVHRHVYPVTHVHTAINVRIHPQRQIFSTKRPNVKFTSESVSYCAPRLLSVFARKCTPSTHHHSGRSSANISAYGTSASDYDGVRSSSHWIPDPSRASARIPFLFAKQRYVPICCPVAFDAQWRSSCRLIGIAILMKPNSDWRLFTACPL